MAPSRRAAEGAAGVAVLELSPPAGGELGLDLVEPLLVRGDELAAEGVHETKAVPHTYRVESEQGARWLVITSHGDFERFVLSLARPAEAGAVPAPSGPPTPEQQRALATAAAAHGIDLIGPPLS